MIQAPKKEEVRRARGNADLTADAAGELVCVSGRQWRKYESGEAGMNPSLWLHFCIRTGQVKPDVK